LNLVEGNGNSIEGIERTTKAKLQFLQEVDGKKFAKTLDFWVEFWEADIEVDAILSFPWMCENKIGIFPHYKALAKDKPVFTLLFGMHDKNQRQKRNTTKIEEIDTAPMHQGQKRNKRGKQKERRGGKPDFYLDTADLGAAAPHIPHIENIDVYSLNCLGLHIPPMGCNIRKHRLTQRELEIVATNLKREGDEKGNIHSSQCC